MQLDRAISFMQHEGCIPGPNKYLDFSLVKCLGNGVQMSGQVRGGYNCGYRVAISRMKWVRYWDDEVIIARDIVDDYVRWVIIFIFIFEFQLFSPWCYHCYWPRPLLRDIFTVPCLFYYHFIYLRLD
jgi:hypothetical protein